MALHPLARHIRDIPDFPKQGILFKDITTLLNDPKAFRQSIDFLAKKVKGTKIDYVVSVEARGFIFGAALAYKLKAGFVPVRKKGKLPWKTRSATYDLEYGTDTLEIHADAIKARSNVLIVDDLLATGGTVEAVASLLRGFKAKIVGALFLMELTFLKGRARLKKMPLFTLIEV
jgi:adenine phosphoribosyltransferase